MPEESRITIRAGSGWLFGVFPAMVMLDGVQVAMLTAGEPTTVSVEIVVPDTPDTKPLIEALSSHVTRGTAVTVPGAFVSRLEIPPPLEPFLNHGTLESISLEPAGGQKEISTTFVARGHDGVEYQLNGVRLRQARAGSEEFEFRSRESETPWVISVIANRATRILTLSFRAPQPLRTPKRALDAARFAHALSSGGVVRCLSEDTGLSIFSCEVAPGSFPTPTTGWLEFLESLVLLQERCRVLVTLPDDISPEDASDVVRFAAQIRAGIVEGAFTGAEISLKPDAPRDVFRKESKDGFWLGVVREEFLDVLGVRFPLGTVAYISTRVRLSEESQLALSRAGAGQGLDLSIEAVDGDSRTRVAYMRWLSESQLAELKALAPGMQFDFSDVAGD